jgi:hypothetical protein
MKEISIRELHRRTGAWVRDARKYGSILIRDRSTPLANSAGTLYATWQGKRVSS